VRGRFAPGWWPSGHAPKTWPASTGFVRSETRRPSGLRSRSAAAEVTLSPCARREGDEGVRHHGRVVRRSLRHDAEADVLETGLRILRRGDAALGRIDALRTVPVEIADRRATPVGAAGRTTDAHEPG